MSHAISMLAMSVIFVSAAGALGCDADRGATPASLLEGPATDPTPPMERERGSVSVQALEIGDDIHLNASAFFGPESGRRVDEGCTIRELDAPGLGESATPSASAGTIRIVVPVDGKRETIALEHDERQATYTFGTVQTGSAPTSPITIRAIGAEVPAFDATLAPMRHVEIVEPVEGAAVAARDLTVRWTAEPGATEIAHLFIGSREILCRPRAGESVVVPAALLASALEGFDPNAATGKPSLFVHSVRTSTIAAGEYDVALTYSTVAVRGLDVEQ